MIPKPLNEIRLVGLEALIGVAWEGKGLEFEAELPRKGESELVRFIAGVSMPANTAGGDFALDVFACDGVPVAVPGRAPIVSVHPTIR